MQVVLLFLPCPWIALQQPGISQLVCLRGVFQPLRYCRLKRLQARHFNHRLQHQPCPTLYQFTVDKIFKGLRRQGDGLSRTAGKAGVRQHLGNSP